MHLDGYLNILIPQVTDEHDELYHNCFLDFTLYIPLPSLLLQLFLMSHLIFLTKILFHHFISPLNDNKSPEIIILISPHICSPLVPHSLNLSSGGGVAGTTVHAQLKQ